MFIVSANYQDRKSDVKWLSRRLGQDHSTARPVKFLIATGVRFINSDAYESGFGCGRVAKCKTVLTATEPGVFTGVIGTRLKFAGYDFEDIYGSAVHGCDMLILMPNGEMYSIGNVYDKTKDALDSGEIDEDYDADDEGVDEAFEEVLSHETP